MCSIFLGSYQTICFSIYIYSVQYTWYIYYCITLILEAIWCLIKQQLNWPSLCHKYLYFTCIYLYNTFTQSRLPLSSQQIGALLKDSTVLKLAVLGFTTFRSVAQNLNRWATPTTIIILFSQISLSLCNNSSRSYPILLSVTDQINSSKAFKKNVFIKLPQVSRLFYTFILSSHN